MNTLKRYIPHKVYDKIKQTDYSQKEHLYIICDMVLRISIYRKQDTDYSNQFIDIPRNYFTDIITNKVSYKSAMDFLINNNILCTDNLYSKEGGKAKGYKFNNEYISILTPVEISKDTLTRKIINNKNNRNNLVNDNLKRYKEYFLKNFKIDYKNSIKYLDKWYEEANSTISTPYNSLLCGTNLDSYLRLINQYNSIFISLSAINDGDLFFKKNITNGRVDTNLTSLKAEYRKFIKQPDLIQIDVCNSQPFILSILLNQSEYENQIDINELSRYTQWTSKGIFYENFQKEYYKYTDKVINRKEIKQMMFCIFYSKNTSYQKEKKIFKMLFPSIMGWIEKQKSNKHNQLAIKMQRIESQICIDCICLELDNQDIDYYTIHDSWLVDKKFITQTQQVIHTCFSKMFNTYPTLKTESVNEKK